MRIGLITPGFSASETDWCIPALLNLVRVLARQHDVHVFTLRYPYRRHSYSVYGAKVHALGGAVAAGFRRLPLIGWALASIVSQHRRRPFDLLHGLWADEPGFLAVIAGYWLKGPTVVSLLGGELVGLSDIGYGSQLSRIGRWLIWFSLRRATRVTVGSTYLHRLARPYVASERLLRIPLGVDTDLFYPESRPVSSPPLLEGRIKLLHVASLIPVKDQSMLLRALSQVVIQEPHVHLHVIGEGPLRRNLEGQVKRLGVTNHVTFHGAIPHERLPAYYRSADLCVLTSRYESQGMVTLEAAACARTTVGTAVGVLPDLTPATRTVPVEDASALSETLLTTLQDLPTVAALGRASLAAVAAHYSQKQMLEKLCSVYAELSATRHP